MAQVVSAVVAYAADRNATTPNYQSFLIDRFGKDVISRFSLVNSKTGLSSTEIVLIERPEMVAEEWCLAAFGDAHIKKLRRDEAASIINGAGSSFTSPAPSP